ncbi:MAG: KH domain-containing protein [Clostridiales bacterium]|jgi:predicted RNA-binding protein YlqC (UPF0109 family)|nr:KH domain-containing protein [Clostridiales bacterium]
MQDLIKFLVKELADTDDVDIKEVDKGGFTDIEIYMDKDEVGKVIGKQGRIAKALRTIVKAAAAKQHIRCNIIIKERGKGGEVDEAADTFDGVED